MSFSLTQGSVAQNILKGRLGVLQTERLALFIDGPNLHASAKALGFEIDYKVLRLEFMRRATLLRAYYYTLILEDDEYSMVRPLVDWLQYNGFTVVAKPAKKFTDGTGHQIVKGSTEVELAVDAIELSRYVDHAVIFSGNGNLKAMVECLQRNSVRVSVVSTIRSHPAMVSDELRRQADNFIDLYDLKELIGRRSRSSMNERKSA